MTLSPSIALDPRIVQHGELLRRRLPAAAVAQLPQVARAFAWRLDQRMAVPGWKAGLLDELGLACTRAMPGLHERQIEDAVVLIFFLLAKEAREDMKTMLDALESIEKTRSELGGLLLQIVDHDQGRLREWPPR